MYQLLIFPFIYHFFIFSLEEIFFSIVMHDDVNILCILPQRFLYFLKVSSSIASEECKSFNQLSVSTHSLRAILNLESISGKLWGYCASEIFAKTLEEDLRIWNIVFELKGMKPGTWRKVTEKEMAELQERLKGSRD